MEIRASARHEGSGRRLPRRNGSGFEGEGRGAAQARAPKARDTSAWAQRWLSSKPRWWLGSKRRWWLGLKAQVWRERKRGWWRSRKLTWCRSRRPIWWGSCAERAGGREPTGPSGAGPACRTSATPPAACRAAPRPSCPVPEKSPCPYRRNPPCHPPRADGPADTPDVPETCCDDRAHSPATSIDFAAPDTPYGRRTAWSEQVSRYPDSLHWLTPVRVARTPGTRASHMRQGLAVQLDDEPLVPRKPQTVSREP